VTLSEAQASALTLGETFRYVAADVTRWMPTDDMDDYISAETVGAGR
jgi:hypothetical protein